MENYISNGSFTEDSISFADAYKKLILERMDQDSRVVLGDADLGRALYGGEYKDLKAKYPKQMYDAGIAEANMIGIAAGLSVVGKIPVAHTFAAFATRRVYDTLFISGAYAGLNIKVIGSDPGITSTYNGGTHITFEDIGLMRAMPKAVIFEPSDIVALRNFFPKLLDTYGILYMRMPRKTAPVRIYPEDTQFELGKAHVVRPGKDATIIALGTQLVESLKAADLLKAEGIDVRVIDPVTVQPLDREKVIAAAKETGAIITVENHSIKTGLFAEVAEVVTSECPCIMEAVGINNEFGEVGNYDELLHRFKLDPASISAAVKKAIAKK